MLKSEIKQDFFSFFFLNYTLILVTWLGGASSKEPACQCRRHKRCWFCPWVGRIQWHPTPVFLPGESHGRRSLVGYSPWGRKESDTTERLHFHFQPVLGSPPLSQMPSSVGFILKFPRSELSSFYPCGQLPAHPVSSRHHYPHCLLKKICVESIIFYYPRLPPILNCPSPLSIRELEKVASLVSQLVKNLPATQETLVWFVGWEDPLEKG